MVITTQSQNRTSSSNMQREGDTDEHVKLQRLVPMRLRTTGIASVILGFLRTECSSMITKNDGIDAEDDDDLIGNDHDRGQRHRHHLRHAHHDHHHHNGDHLAKAGMITHPITQSNPS